MDISESLKSCEAFLKTWKTWLLVSYSQFIKNKKNLKFGLNVMVILNMAMKYKPYKTKMYFVYFFLVLNSYDN